MSTAAQITANQTNAQNGIQAKPYPRNAEAQTSATGRGPSTQPGKDRSARNATTEGLFTARDFIRPNEHEQYAAHCAALHAELNPDGALENTFAEAIIGATWRLRRCAAVESRMAARMAEVATDPGTLDPMEADDPTRRLQLSVDRARAQAHNLLRRSLAELRRLQTQRQLRTAMFEDAPDPPAPDLTSYDEVSIALDRLDRTRLRLRKLAHADALAAIMGPLPNEVPDAAPKLGSFCNAPSDTLIS
jgi:hypothetical protein